ncbi:hypothetical protein KY289_000429 [Solanum tuberosum]|nr:hypothetical protein KY284_000447 [Solanum tuberosum]KAH0729241.1 hypothetical protein KY289_000429 [Solanum tuberosum]
MKRFLDKKRTRIRSSRQSFPDYITSRNSKLKVKDFLVNHRWNIPKLYITLPCNIALHITSIELGLDDRLDYAIWTNSEDCQYSNVSAWENIREHRQRDSFINNIWHNSIPFKMSFLCLRLIAKKLPFTEARAKFLTQDDIDCVCCPVPQSESIQHVFVEGKAAEHIWRTLGRPLGIIHQQVHAQNILNNWWKTKSSNEIHKLILKATLILIFREIWIAWTGYRYGNNNKFHHYKMVTQCIWNIKVVFHDSFPSIDMKESWNRICEKIERIRIPIRCSFVCWIRPQNGMVKINTDGSFFSNDKRAGIGGVENSDMPIVARLILSTWYQSEVPLKPSTPCCIDVYVRRDLEKTIAYTQKREFGDFITN